MDTEFQREMMADMMADKAGFVKAVEGDVQTAFMFMAVTWLLRKHSEQSTEARTSTKLFCKTMLKAILQEFQARTLGDKRLADMPAPFKKDVCREAVKNASRRINGLIFKRDMDDAWKDETLVEALEHLTKMEDEGLEPEDV